MTATSILAAPRPPRAGAATATLAFAWRSLLKIRHVPEQLGDVIGIPVLFTLMFTYLFGGALAGSTHDYLQFLLPGTLVMTVVLVTVYAGVALNTDRASGVFDRYRTLPVWRPAPFAGALLGDAARYLLAAAIVLALGLAMGFRPAAGAPGVLAAVALTLAFAFGLGWVFVALGLVLRTPNAVMSTGMAILFPLGFASNVFVDPATLPGWLRAFVDVNPVAHLVTAVRALMAGTATAGQVGWVLLAAAALTAVFGALSMRAYRAT